MNDQIKDNIKNFNKGSNRNLNQIDINENSNIAQDQLELQIGNNKESLNMNNDKQEVKTQNYNLNFSRHIELKSHFDVIRRVGYMPHLNSLISISEVLIY
jgi:hypothetical protein